MNTTRWIRVTSIGNVPPREGRAVLVGEREIALFHLGPSTALGTGDQFLATDNQCPHKGGPLCDGIVTGSSVVCPLHAWKVNLETGQVERPSHGKDHCVTTYPTRVEEGVVLIGLPAAVAGTPEGVPCGKSGDVARTPEGVPYGESGDARAGHPFKGATAGAAA